MLPFFLVMNIGAALIFEQFNCYCNRMWGVPLFLFCLSLLFFDPT